MELRLATLRAAGGIPGFFLNGRSNGSFLVPLDLQ